MEARSPRPWFERVREAIHATLDAHQEPPAEHAWLRRALHGALLPFAVLRGLLRDPAARARYLRVTAWQLAAMIGVTAGLVWIGATPLNLREGSALERVSALYGALCVAEMIVLAFAREYQDAVCFDAATLAGVPMEPLAAPPSVGLNFAWLRTKTWRRLRAALILASGAPLFVFAWFVPAAGDRLYQGLGALWTAHWLAVFCVGGAPIAWELHPKRAPWFLRVADALGEVPFIGWMFRLYARLWRGWFGAVLPICGAAEAAPYEAVGLVLARGVAGLPGLYLFLRPMFPVAATQVVFARVPEARSAQAPVANMVPLTLRAETPELSRAAGAREH